MHKVVYQHAIDNYIDRVLDGDPPHPPQDVRMYAESRIEQCIDFPDEVIEGKDGKPQIHLKDGMAVPVGVPHPGPGKLRPYNEDDDKVYAPTVYEAGGV